MNFSYLNIEVDTDANLVIQTFYSPKKSYGTIQMH